MNSTVASMAAAKPWNFVGITAAGGKAQHDDEQNCHDHHHDDVFGDGKINPHKWISGRCTTPTNGNSSSRLSLM
jgi:ABC-type Zn2+ transport system substrate-binding protein/surface adhesin